MDKLLQKKLCNAMKTHCESTGDLIDNDWCDIPHNRYIKKGVVGHECHNVETLVNGWEGVLQTEPHMGYKYPGYPKDPYTNVNVPGDTFVTACTQYIDTVNEQLPPGIARLLAVMLTQDHPDSYYYNVDVLRDIITNPIVEIVPEDPVGQERQQRQQRQQRQRIERLSREQRQIRQQRQRGQQREQGIHNSYFIITSYQPRDRPTKMFFRHSPQTVEVYDTYADASANENMKFRLKKSDVVNRYVFSGRSFANVAEYEAFIAHVRSIPSAYYNVASNAIVVNDASKNLLTDHHQLYNIVSPIPSNSSNPEYTMHIEDYSVFVSIDRDNNGYVQSDGGFLMAFTTINRILFSIELNHDLPENEAVTGVYDIIKTICDSCRMSRNNADNSLRLRTTNYEPGTVFLTDILPLYKIAKFLKELLDSH